MTNESWEDDLATIGNVLRVNARFLGECFPLNTSSCELWVAYGNFILRRFNADTMTLLDEWTDVANAHKRLSGRTIRVGVPIPSEPTKYLISSLIMCG